MLLELHRANVFKVNFHLEKDDQHYPVKDFPKIVSKFLKQDVFKNKENVESLMENMLLLENVDSEFPHNNKLVVNMQDQTVSDKFKKDRSLHRNSNQSCQSYTQKTKRILGKIHCHFHSSATAISR